MSSLLSKYISNVCTCTNAHCHVQPCLTHHTKKMRNVEFPHQREYWQSAVNRFKLLWKRTKDLATQPKYYRPFWSKSQRVILYYNMYLHRHVRQNPFRQSSNNFLALGLVIIAVVCTFFLQPNCLISKVNRSIFTKNIVLNYLQSLATTNSPMIFH